MKQHSFDKFINTEKNSKKKEAFRQEKKKWKEEKKKKYEERNTRSETRNPKLKMEKTVNSKLRAQTPEFKNQQTYEMPLNKFIAHAGVCGRREAAELVKEGKIKV